SLPHETAKEQDATGAAIFDVLFLELALQEYTYLLFLRLFSFLMPSLLLVQVKPQKPIQLQLG
ncbi:hypothetical protein LCGC14_2988140, partial [marine sediment metagenome]